MAGGGRENFSISYPDLPWSGEREDPTFSHFRICSEVWVQDYGFLSCSSLFIKFYKYTCMGFFNCLSIIIQKVVWHYCQCRVITRCHVLVTRVYARVITAARNASHMPRRLEHVHCAYSNTSAFRGCKPEVLRRNSEKICSFTLFKSDLRLINESLRWRRYISIVKCVSGDVWKRVTAE